MDVAMPGMDGYETTRAIRSAERFRALPIIAVSGRVDDLERAELHRLRGERLRAKAG